MTGCQSKRGSAQVEAAMVLPLVLLAVIAAVWLMVYFYSQTAVRAGVHLALRCEAGILSDTVLCEDDERADALSLAPLSAERAEVSLSDKAAEYVRRMGLSSVPELSGQYKWGSKPPRLSIKFRKEYRGAGLYHGNNARNGAAVQYLIDEAQWVRNWNWVRDELLQETKAKE